jgi:tetratricopeptide (TPR) repeat protein
LVALMLLAGSGAFAWWQLRKPEPAFDPPLPEGIQEAEIIQLFEKHRATIRANPKSGDAWGRYAMTLLAHLFDREATRCFAEAHRVAPEDPRWIYGEAHIALKRDPPTALPLLKQAIATTGPGQVYRSMAKLALAEALQEKGEIDEAAKLFNEELGPPPGEPRAVFGLGLIALARGDEPKATRLLSSLLANRNARKKVRTYLARLAWNRHDETAARKFELEAAALPDDPVWPDPLLDEIVGMSVGRRGRDRLVTEYERAGLYREALQEYLNQLAEERTPKYLLGAAINYIRLKQYDAALPLIHEALEREPNSPQAHYTMALAYFNPAEIEVHNHPGSEKAKEWFRESIVHSKRATELKPDLARAYLHWGLSLKHLGDPKDAVAPLRKGVSVRPEDFDLHFSLGEVLALTGETAEAETYFKNAQAIDPKDPRPAQELEKLKEKK